MNDDPFDELPDNIKETIREMMKKLQDINPEDLENMMRQMFGEEFMEKMRDMQSSGDSFGFPMDPKMMKNFEGMMRGFTDQKDASQPAQQEKIMVEEPYYEYSSLSDEEVELIVDLPGIDDLRQINWKRIQNIFTLEAENEDVKYFLEIPVKENMIFKDTFASLKNSVFILPIRRE